MFQHSIKYNKDPKIYVFRSKNFYFTLALTDIQNKCDCSSVLHPPPKQKKRT